MERVLLGFLAGCVLATAAFVQRDKATASAAQYPASEQDATVAAARNYKVELENELVRVVRVTYGPHEKSPLHEHQGNAVVIVVLKGGGKMRQTSADGTTVDGKTEEVGTVRFVPARSPFKHASENVADYPLETIRIELKTPPCGTKPQP